MERGAPQGYFFQGANFVVTIFGQAKIVTGSLCTQSINEQIVKRLLNKPTKLSRPANIQEVESNVLKTKNQHLIGAVF